VTRRSGSSATAPSESALKGSPRTLAASAADSFFTCRPRNGARVIPDGTITAAHFVKTPLYVQISGFGDLYVFTPCHGCARANTEPFCTLLGLRSTSRPATREASSTRTALPVSATPSVAT
jgi:hypothetical protein